MKLKLTTILCAFMLMMLGTGIAQAATVYYSYFSYSLVTNYGYQTKTFSVVGSSNYDTYVVDSNVVKFPSAEPVKYTLKLYRADTNVQVGKTWTCKGYCDYTPWTITRTGKYYIQSVVVNRVSGQSYAHSATLVGYRSK